MTSTSPADTGAYDPHAQVHLGVFYPGVGPQLIWTDPAAPSHVAIETFVETARLLERGLFDAFFLGEGLRVRENRGRVYDLDIAGRPDAITQLAALAAVTSRIGLVATQNTTYNYPADLARRLASLDVLSDGRAGWNVVTTDNAWTGANFRHGGWLPHERRYERAEQFVASAKALWAEGNADAVAESTGAVREVVRDTDLVRLRARPTVPISRQGGPVIFQAGDSDGGRELAARHADAVFSSNTDYDKAVAYAVDLRARLARHGRSPDSVRILPGASVVLGDTPAEAAEAARWARDEQLTAPRVLAYFEQYWGTDLSAYDPDGPLPDIEPSAEELDPSRGTHNTWMITDDTPEIARSRRLGHHLDNRLVETYSHVSGPMQQRLLANLEHSWRVLLDEADVDSVAPSTVGAPGGMPAASMGRATGATTAQVPTAQRLAGVDHHTLSRCDAEASRDAPDDGRGNVARDTIGTCDDEALHRYRAAHDEPVSVRDNDGALRHNPLRIRQVDHRYDGTTGKSYLFDIQWSDLPPDDGTTGSCQAHDEAA